MNQSIRAAVGAPKPYSRHPAPTISIKDRLTLRLPDAVLYSGLGRSSLYKLLSSGRLRSVKVGSRRLILRESLDALMDHLGREGL